MVKKDKQLNKVKKSLNNLVNSPLYQYRSENNYQPVVGQGSMDAKVMFIGEAPGEKEALSGIPFCGASGRILDELLASIDLDRDTVYITNVVKDRPPKNRDPKADEIALYTPFLKQQIKIIKPLVVATLGRFAMEFMFNNFNNDLEIITKGKKSGQVKLPKISDARAQSFNLEGESGESFILLPLYHPAVALYNPNKKTELLADFKKLQDLI